MSKKKANKPRVWGGIGKKMKDGKGTQWSIQNRIFDSECVSPALTAYKSDYWIIVKEKEEEDENE